MATETITIADSRLSDVLDYVARARNYTGHDLAGAAETKAAFLHRMVVEQLQIWVAVGRNMEIQEQIQDGSIRQRFGIS